MDLYGPSYMLLERGELPQAAQTVAARNRDLLVALAQAEQIPYDVWKVAFQSGLPVDLAGQLVVRGGDARCVQVVLDSKEKRIGVMKSLFYRWVPTKKQQETLAARALPTGLADFLLDQPWFLPEAGSKLISRASAEKRFLWAVDAPAGIDDTTLNDHIKQSLDAGTGLSFGREAGNIAKLAHLRPGCIAGLLDMPHKSVLAGLSMVPLKPAYQENETAKTTKKNTGDSACQFRLLWDKLSNGPVHLDVTCNLLMRPDCPVTLKTEIWESLDVSDQSEILARGVGSPDAQTVVNCVVEDIKDPIMLESLIRGDITRALSGRPWLWLELTANEHLPENLAKLLMARTSLRLPGVGRGEIFSTIKTRLRSRYGWASCADGNQPTSTNSRQVDDCYSREFWVKKLNETTLPVPAPKRPQHGRVLAAGSHMFGALPNYDKPIEDVLVLGDSTGEAGSRRIFEWREDEIAAWLTERLKENEAKWELFFSFADGFEGTIQELVEMIESVCEV